MGAEPPVPVQAPPVRRQPPRKKTSRALGGRRSRRRVTPWIVGIVVAAAVVAAIAGSKISANKSSEQFDALATSGGCGKVQIVAIPSRRHLDGQRIHYSTSPPAGGDHYSVPLDAGFYDEPLTTSTASPTTSKSIYRAVHSLEHGAVIIWFNDLSPSQTSTLKDHYGSEDHVIVAPYPKLKPGDKIALSAWGRLDYCTKASTKVIDAFIRRFRAAHTAPEAGLPI
jgi:hypothetical protein